MNVSPPLITHPYPPGLTEIEQDYRPTGRRVIEGMTG